MKAILLLVYTCFWGALVAAQGLPLPKNVAVISGFPLTIPENFLEHYGMTREQNTGGWGDVMANVTSAIEMKTKYPSINVRLIVTLNETDAREYVNKTKNIVLKSMAGPSGEAVLNPDLKTAQYYQGVEVYFVNLPVDFYERSEKWSDPKVLEKIKDATKHIPVSEVGVQFSANGRPVDPQIGKIQKLYLNFHEFGTETVDLQDISPKKKPMTMSLHTGPFSFGLYGFGANKPAQNKKIIQSYMNQKNIQNFDFSNAEIAYAYAGDQTLMDDYVAAIKILSQKNKRTPYFVFTKGSGEITVDRNLTMIPLGAHSKELAHALIARSTYSPLVTGDGSLSSALASTSVKGRPKSFLYELVHWKEVLLNTMLAKIFENSDLINKASSLLFAELYDKENPKLRKERVKNIIAALDSADVHTHLHRYFRKNVKRLDVVDNTVNVFQLEREFKSTPLSDKEHIAALLNLTKEMRVSDDIQKMTEKISSIKSCWTLFN